MIDALAKADRILQKYFQHDDETAIANSMVCQLWFDGEITLQKGGELFGQRSLHMIVEGAIPETDQVAKVVEQFLKEKFNRSYIFVESTKVAEEIRKEVFGDD